jgi:hypothetical protein
MAVGSNGVDVPVERFLFRSKNLISKRCVRQPVAGIGREDGHKRLVGNAVFGAVERGNREWVWGMFPPGLKKTDWRLVAKMAFSGNVGVFRK